MFQPSNPKGNIYTINIKKLLQMLRKQDKQKQVDAIKFNNVVHCVEERS